MLEVKYVKLSELETWPRNPKHHDVQGIQRSIRRFGFTLPVVVDEGTGRLVAGHGRQEALSGMKVAGEKPPKNIQVSGSEWLVPVVKGNHFENEAEAERYLIADNRFVEVGGWNDHQLLEILSSQQGPDLLAMGFDQGEVERLVTVQEHERRWATGELVDDPRGEWGGMPEFDQEDATAFRSIKVHFKDEEAIKQFEETIGRKLPERAGYLWFPETEIGHFADKRYVSVAEEEEEDGDAA